MIITCMRCGHMWAPNVPSPVVCAKCHSPYYNIPRRNKVHNIVNNTAHTEPLVTQTPNIHTPQYTNYPPPQVNFGEVTSEPPIVFTSPPVLKSHVEEESEFHINPERDMPIPLRKCKICGYKGYGEYFKNHSCRR